MVMRGVTHKGNLSLSGEKVAVIAAGDRASISSADLS